MRASGWSLGAAAFFAWAASSATAQEPARTTPSFGANPNAATANVMRMWERGGPARHPQIAVNPVCAPGGGRSNGVWPGRWNGQWSCQPCGNPCNYPWYYGAQGFWGVSNFVNVPVYSTAYFPIYGYDPYAANLELQNLQLQLELERAQNANRQILQNVDGERNRIAALKNGRNGDRTKNQQAKSKQIAAAADKHFAAGMYLKAAERFREAIRIDAEESSNQFKLAQSLFAARRYAEASAALKEALRQNPNWIELDFDLRSLYENGDSLTSQLADLARMVRANPLDRDATFLLGFELFMTGQKDKARPILEQSARLEVNDAHLRPFLDYFDRQAQAN